MRIRIVLTSATLAAALAAAGCATPESRAAEYEKALAPWQGASEEALVARWGPPQAQEQIGRGRWLTYVVRSTAPSAPTVAFSIGGFGFLTNRSQSQSKWSVIQNVPAYRYKSDQCDAEDNWRLR